MSTMSFLVLNVIFEVKRQHDKMTQKAKQNSKKGLDLDSKVGIVYICL